MLKFNKTNLILLVSWTIYPIILFLVFGNLYAHQKNRNLKENAYRSHEKYTTNNHKYYPNINAKYVNRYGDLCNMNTLRENCYFSSGAREHTFRTDKYGYKTLSEIENSDLVIIGDSFLAASGGDNMEDQLGQVLSKNTTPM